MCLVPLFFESLETHRGLMKMVVIATKSPNVADIIGNIAWKVQARGVRILLYTTYMRGKDILLYTTYIDIELVLRLTACTSIS